MKLIIRITCALLSLSVVACNQSTDIKTIATQANATAESASGLAAPSQLRRQGVFMVDEKNRVVLLHGVNAVWKVAPFVPPNTAAGFTAADADWLHDHGFNSVRLGVLFQAVMPQQGVVDQNYLQAMDRVVQLLTSRGIYVLFDFHQDVYNQKFGGEGFPDWAVYDDGIPHVIPAPFPAGYFLPETGRAFDNLWDNHLNLWDHYRTAWKAVAQKWKSQDHHGGYDLLNEPYPGTVWLTCANPVGCPVFDDQKLQPFYEHVMAGIREVDASNLVFLEPNFLFSGSARTGLGLLHPLTDPNLGFSWHKYCLLGLLLHSQGATDIPTCEQFHQLVNVSAQAAVQQIGSTSLITEFGASDDLADVNQVVSQADSLLTGWQYWHYKEWGDPTTESQTSGGQGLFAKDGDLSTVKLAKLKLLERAYPQATAGTPLALSFDEASGAFSYHYIPRAAAGPTEIYVPVLHYPNGYKLQVTGARSLSAANATRLQLENLPGATEVSVTITKL